MESRTQVGDWQLQEEHIASRSKVGDDQTNTEERGQNTKEEAERTDLAIFNNPQLVAHCSDQVFVVAHHQHSYVSRARSTPKRT
jgi:hypothetical protein